MPVVVGIEELINRRLKDHHLYVDGMKVERYVYDPIDTTYNIEIRIPTVTGETLSEDKVNQITKEVCEGAFKVTLV